MKKLLLVFLILPFYFLILLISSYLNVLISPVLAADFSTSFDILYEVLPTGETVVNQNITYTNLVSGKYVSAATLKLGPNKIYDVVASDPAGALKPEIKEEGGETKIQVEFKERVVGKDKSLTWNVHYKSRDFSSQNGKVWEINLPRFADEEIADYNIALSIPTSFGPLAYIAPPPKEVKTFFNKNAYVFDKKTLGQNAVSASFGQVQVFKFKLTYHLENPNLVSVSTDIALPPDTNYQEVIYEKIEPTPLDVRVDGDGNYLARYGLAKKEKLIVLAMGFVRLYHQPKRNSQVQLSEEEAKNYLLSQKYWETDNLTILNKARELKTVKQIYDFVVATLSYDQKKLEDEKIERLGAVAALQNPQNAVCMEFTDLFIALARAAGIPSREVDGYAYTTNPKLRPLSLRSSNQDVLHAWPEYYDQETKQWIMIDPTWAKTTGGVDFFSKMDFNHVAFVKKGLSSQTPYPAGAYKIAGSQEKDVAVELSFEFPTPAPKIELQFNWPKNLVAGFPGQAEIIVKNTGNAASFPNKLIIEPKIIEILGEKTVDLGVLPAYTNRVVKINFRTSDFLLNIEDEIKVAGAGQEKSFKVKIAPLYFSQQILILVGGVLGGLIFSLAVIAIAKKARGLYLQRSKK